MPTALLRVIVVVLILPLNSAGLIACSLDQATSTVLDGIARPRFPEQALAPAVASGIRCLDKARPLVVRGYEDVLKMASLPRYSGAGETSIHKAIQEAERWLNEGKRPEAMALLDELHQDLVRAQEGQQVEVLMDKWNVRYPASLAVDVFQTDLSRFLRRVEALMDLVLREELAAGGPELREAAKGWGYGSVEEMLRDYIDTERMETTFTVDVAQPLQKSLGGTRLSLTITGIPKVTSLLFELESQYPALRGQIWALRIEPAVESIEDTVLPEQKLTVIIPAQGLDSPSTFGPLHRSIWSIPLVITALLFGASPSAHLVVVVISVALTTLGALTDPNFVADPAARFEARLPTSA
jgi:hypothetical protein